MYGNIIFIKQVHLRVSGSGTLKAANSIGHIAILMQLTVT